LASSADPERAALVRIAFAETIKKLDPLDAKLLEVLGQQEGGRLPDSQRQKFTIEAKVPNDAVMVSAENLEKLGLVTNIHTGGITLTWFGRELVRVLRLSK
jgi:hypothetical protein